MQALSAGEIDKLSSDERLNLISQLWDSLQNTDVHVPAAQQAELERRLSSLGQDRTHTITWDQLRAELARRTS